MTDAPGGPLARHEPWLRYAMGALYVVAGVAHFLAPRTYAQVVPPGFPRPLALVFLSGAAEVALGLGVIHPRTRRLSAWGIVALLVAVFPANVYMATGDVALDGVPAWAADPPDAALWARLPLQAVLVCWAYRYTRPTDGRERDAG
jgi:uncharacterized membrane protein